MPAAPRRGPPCIVPLGTRPSFNASCTRYFSILIINCQDKLQLLQGDEQLHRTCEEKLTTA